MSNPSDDDVIYFPPSDLREAMHKLADLNASMQSSWFAEKGDEVVQAMLFFLDAHRRTSTSIIERLDELAPELEGDALIEYRRNVVMVYELRYYASLLNELKLSLPDQFYDGVFPVNEWIGTSRPKEG